MKSFVVLPIFIKQGVFESVLETLEVWSLLWFQSPTLEQFKFSLNSLLFSTCHIFTTFPNPKLHSIETVSNLSQKQNVEDLLKEKRERTECPTKNLAREKLHQKGRRTNTIRTHFV